MSDSAAAGNVSMQDLIPAYDTSWMDINVTPPSTSLVQAALDGTDVQAKDPEDPTKAAPQVLNANGGVDPGALTAGVAATVGHIMGRTATDVGVPVATMQQLFEQGKKAGAAQVADVLQQGQAQAAVAQNANAIEQAKTVDLAKTNAMLLGDPTDPNSIVARTASTINGAQQTALGLSQDLNEKNKIGLFDNPIQFFVNQITSIGEQDRLDSLQQNIVSNQTILKNQAGLSTDLGKLTAAADTTGLIEKGRLEAESILAAAKTQSDAIAEKSMNTNISNLSTISQTSIAGANLQINQSRLITDQQNTLLHAAQIQLEVNKQPYYDALSQERIDNLNEKLQDNAATTATLRAAATSLGLKDGTSMTLPIYKSLPKPVQAIVLAASQGAAGVVAGSPASALDSFNTIKGPNISPVVANTINQMRELVAANAVVANKQATLQFGKQDISSLPKPEQLKIYDAIINDRVDNQIRQGPEATGAKGFYSLPALNTAISPPWMQDKQFTIMPAIKQIAAQGGNQYPVQSKDFLETAYDQYKQNPTPSTLSNVSQQVSRLFQGMVNVRNTTNNYPFLGLPAPNSYNSVANVGGSKLQLDMTQQNAVQQYLMKRRIADQSGDLAGNTQLMGGFQ